MWEGEPGLHGALWTKSFRSDVTPFFRSESYESCLAASASWQEDCEHHDEKEEKAFA